MADIVKDLRAKARDADHGNGVVHSSYLEDAASEIEMLREQMVELREAAYDYAHLIHVENFPTYDMASGRAYERLRKALGQPVGLKAKPRLASA